MRKKNAKLQFFNRKNRRPEGMPAKVQVLFSLIVQIALISKIFLHNRRNLPIFCHERDEKMQNCRL